MNLAVHFRQKRRWKGILEHRRELWVGGMHFAYLPAWGCHIYEQYMFSTTHSFLIRRFAEWISRSFGRRDMLLCHIVWLATNLFGSMESEWRWQSFQSKNSKKHCVPLPASCSFPPITRTTCPMQRLFLKPGFQKERTQWSRIAYWQPPTCSMSKKYNLEF